MIKQHTSGTGTDAAQLIIGAGTVKTHTLNIYRKLEVGNRTQAIVRAQELGFLPS